MKKRVLAGMALPLSLAFLQPPASAQAAAESVMVHGTSAAAAAKAGSVLGSTMNRVGKQMGERVQQTVQPGSQGVSQTVTHRSATVPVRSTAASAGTTPAEGPMIASVVGTAPKCASTAQPASTPEGKTAPESASTNCSAQNSAGSPASQKYKSTVTVSFPK